MYAVNQRDLRVAVSGVVGAVIDDLALTSGVAVYSEAIPTDRNVGCSTLLITEDKSGGAGDVDIYPEYSMDGTNWHRANTTSAGSLTQDANIVTTLQNATKWIVLTLRMAKYVRFVFDPDADSQITAKLLFQEQY